MIKGGKINKFFIGIILSLLYTTNSIAMLKKELMVERNRRKISILYKDYINFFAEELHNSLTGLQQHISKKVLLPKTFYDTLQNKQGLSPEKITLLKIVLKSPDTLIFQPKIQKLLIKTAKSKITNNVFAGKIQLFYNLEANKKVFENTLIMRVKKNGNEFDPKIAKKLNNEALNDYENKQLYLFFDILADLLNTQDLKKLLY